MKKCTVCKIDKNLNEFYNSKSYKDGKAYRCKVCDRIARKNYYHKHKEKFLENKRRVNRKFKYNLTDEEYNNLIKDQKGLCAICNIQLKNYYNTNKSDTMCVDHSHKTGKVRGLLCSNCNKALGLFKDDINSLISAISYLRKEIH